MGRRGPSFGLVIAVIVVGVLVVLGALYATGVLPHATPSPSGTSSGGKGGTPTRSPDYVVRFAETGLPAGTDWTVYVGSSNASSTSATIAFSEANGSFAYRIGSITGYVASPSSGTAIVNGANVTEPIAFAVPTPSYAVDFTESGLPNATEWNVTLAGTTSSSRLASISFSEPDGSYAFSVSAGPGYYPTPSSGWANVSGMALSEPIGFGIPPPSQTTLGLGGATAAFPFDQLWVSQFEQNDTNVVISDNQGGSRAGMLAVCGGQVDIGVASMPENLTTLETDDGCPRTATITYGAYDAVGVVVPRADPHGLESLSWDTLTAIYDGATITEGGTPTLNAPSIDGTSLGTAPLSGASWVSGGKISAGLAWDEIPACVAGATNCGGTGNPTEALATSIGAGAACTAGVDICATGAGASPCGFTVCAGPFSGSNGTNAIRTAGRSDGSGDTQTFEARLLGAVNGSAFAASTAALGFSGCGSDNLLADCGLTPTVTANGAENLLEAIANDSDAIGYAPLGPAGATGSGVSVLPFLGIGESASNGSAGGRSGGVVPSLGGSGTLEASINGSTSGPRYVGWIPFTYVTINTPTGEIERFLNFLMDPANNQNLAAEADVVSLYSL